MSKLTWSKKETRDESGYYDATYQSQCYWTACLTYTLSRDRSRGEDRYGTVGQWEVFSPWAVYDEKARTKLREFKTVSEAKRWVKDYDLVPQIPAA